MFARDWGFEAIDKLAALMRGVVRVEIDGKPVEMLVPMAQLAAANALLGRGYGRPQQAVELMGKDDGAIQTEEVDPVEIIETRLAAIRERLRRVEPRRIDRTLSAASGKEVRLRPRPFP